MPRASRRAIDHLVDFAHDPDGFVQGDDDLLVVGDVVGRERATLAVLKPLVADLVAADVEVPDCFRDALRPIVPDRCVGPFCSSGDRPKTALLPHHATRPTSGLFGPM